MRFFHRSGLHIHSLSLSHSPLDVFWPDDQISVAAVKYKVSEMVLEEQGDGGRCQTWFRRLT